MIKYEDFCCQCELHCLGGSCPNVNVEVHCCDECETQGTLYYFDGGEYCLDCIKKMLDTETGECDDCGFEETLYILDDKKLCADCLEFALEEV